MAGRDAKPQDLLFVANQALALWQQCEFAREIEIDRQTRYARASIQADSKPKLPRPNKFPASHDDFLKCMMPKKRPEDKAKCYREYVRQTFRDMPATEESVAQIITRDKQREISEGVFDLHAADFQRWLKEYEAANRRRRAQAGAAALKEKRLQNG